MYGCIVKNLKLFLLRRELFGPTLFLDPGSVNRSKSCLPLTTSETVCVYPLLGGPSQDL